MGVPRDFEELQAWVEAGRLENLVRDKTVEAYLEYITNGQFSIESKDWREYRTGNPGMSRNEGTGDMVKDMPTKGSTFFHKAVGASGVPPHEAWRVAASRSRELLGQLLKDQQIRYQLEIGEFFSWDDLESKLLEYRALDDHQDDYPRLIVLRKEIKKLLSSSENPKLNMGSLLSSCRPFLCDQNSDTASNPEFSIENPTVWKSSNVRTAYKGPETSFQPIFNTLGVVLSSLNLSDKDFTAAEEEWLKVHKSMNPEILSKNRPELLDWLTKMSKDKSSGAYKVNEVAEVTKEDLENASEDYLAEKLEETISDKTEFDRICAVQEKRFRRIGFKKRGGKLKRFQRFQNSGGTNEGSNRGRGFNRGHSRGRGSRGRGRGRGHFSNSNNQGHICFDCHNRGAGLHYQKDCPLRVRLVDELNEAQNAGYSLAQQADRIRQVFDEMDVNKDTTEENQPDAAF